MQKKSVLSVIGEFITSLAKFLAPVAVLGVVAYGVWHLLPFLSPVTALYISIGIALCALVFAFTLYHADKDIFIAYGAGCGGIALLYASVYYAYVGHALLTPNTLFWSLSANTFASFWL